MERGAQFERIISPEGKELGNVTEEFFDKILTSPEVIGSGQTAEILVNNDYPDGENFCVKKITNLDSPFFPRKSIDHELGVQRQIHQIPGVRVPEPIAGAVVRYDDGSRGQFALMERIFGHSVADILDQRLDLPPGFDVEKFVADLRGMVDKMHKRDYYHRDLHEGNVMVEWDTFSPVIIDFGLSKKAVTQEEREHPYIDFGFSRPGHVPVATNDLTNITRRIQNPLRRYALS
ncbi:MAG: hypothetical protein COT81_05300 [Candidatus Buchananbacteria bacterium CG10_big_fil_rev_8_21_14_0_10_42_9]|uniref:Protein kinase domain-containing protein n=1 Tax=Candidatus Buchananbacteria bacterium CG10_big_fil_rev_8_21_14_0_10_42_9 TaxID=1974526 RepID=A0A2H0VZZ7_9BACT|nr:MAG: hypothetical protein COT81_05300 [Candidatus Buchananbacteria bacterium CG10_big_fil_rev_8_21_14_0_10_42_9]